MVIRTPYGNRFGSVFGSRFFNAHETSSTPLVLDPDAETYIAAVESADGQELELAVKVAYNNFILGCKDDGIWDAIKASCILAGARTLTGALVPLVGTAPTNNNFVSGDYSRTTGLVGDGSTKYLNSNRANNADPQNNNHNAFYRTSTGGVAAQVMATAFVSGENTFYDNNTGSYNVRNRSISVINSIGTATTGFAGVNRSSSSQITLRSNNATSTHSLTSQTPSSTNIGIFGALGSPNNPGRLSFYSIGASLDLALLDSRVTALVNEVAFYLNTGLDPAGYDIDTVKYINAGYAAGGSLS